VFFHAKTSSASPAEQTDQAEIDRQERPVARAMNQRIKPIRLGVASVAGQEGVGLCRDEPANALSSNKPAVCVPPGEQETVTDPGGLDAVIVERKVMTTLQAALIRSDVTFEWLSTLSLPTRS
jgi:hypothetical protein